MKNADSLGSDNHGDNCIKTSGCIYILLLWEIYKNTQKVPLEDFLEYYYPVPTQ